MTQTATTFPRMTMLTRDQCESVHLASLELLRRTGVRVHHSGALALLRDSDAVVHPMRVRVSLYADGAIDADSSSPHACAG